jgi:hypothetical protein
MMEDYKSIVNNLINSGLHHEIGLEKHYYPLAATDTTGKPKSIPPERELRDLNNDLYSIQESKPDGTMRIRITIAPHQSLVIVPYGLRLCFTDDTPVPKSKESGGL